MKPRCKCGKVCAYYGPIGGYSVKCVGCNAKHAAWQRRNRAERSVRRDRRKTHAMNMVLEVLCGRRAKVTSIVRGPRDPLAKLVTCRSCLKRLHGASHG